MLDYAMGKIKSVPYKVSSRWVFYRLVQGGFIRKSETHKFDYVLSRARKGFYGEWQPDTLTDSIRQASFKGELSVSYGVELDNIECQDYYAQLWFEAEAMHGQFEYFTKKYRVSLVPFRGDCSIPIKWELAKKLEAAYGKYEKPVKILYFGDCDKKGYQILEAALKDIRAWCTAPFDVERVGLTIEQAREFGLPENPDKPDSYQWEALENDHAEKLILESLSKYQKSISTTLEEQEKVIRGRIRTQIIEVLNVELGVDFQ
jgi:hypothetical protein